MRIPKLQSFSPANGVDFSVGAESGLTVGNLKDFYKWSLGGSLQVDIPVDTQLYVNINAGYQNCVGKDNAYGRKLSTMDFHMIPVKTGLKACLVKDFYIQGEANADFVFNKSHVGYKNAAAFIYAPSIGI